MMGDRVSRRGCGRSFWSGTSATVGDDEHFWSKPQIIDVEGLAGETTYAASARAVSPMAARWW
jgi:hypothetical protein